jgi:hypothetical protein
MKRRRKGEGNRNKRTKRRGKIKRKEDMRCREVLRDGRKQRTPSLDRFHSQQPSEDTQQQWSVDYAVGACRVLGDQAHL